MTAKGVQSVGATNAVVKEGAQFAFSVSRWPVIRIFFLSIFLYLSPSFLSSNVQFFSFLYSAGLRAG
jgi:hypothetical protein